jgi:hypothetical protein
MRTLTPSLQAAIDSPVRLPDYRLYAFDPSLDDYTAIILGTYTQTPLDLTEFCNNVNWSPAQIGFVLIDEDGSFHPDSGQYKNYVQDGAIIRLLEGDTRVPVAEWVWTFTGAIKGQSGWTKGVRDKGTSLTAKVNAYSRDNCQAFKRRSITTKEYTAGTDLGILCQDLGTDFMGLSEDEILIPRNLGRTLMHKSNQLVQVAPWDGLTSVLQVVSQVPIFNGEGRLTSWDKNLARLPDVSLPDYVRIHQVDIPQQTGDVINRVVVIFLDSNLTQVDGANQILGTAHIEPGYFQGDYKLPVFWSDDRKQRASNTYMIIKQSASNSFTKFFWWPLEIITESYQAEDEYGGQIKLHINMVVDIFMLIDIFTAWIPGMGQFSLLSAILIMLSLGNGQYEIWGVPYDMAYLEKRSIAVEAGLQYYEENEEQIRNDFIGSHDQADTVALTELIYQKSSGSPRKVILDDYLQLEIGDICQLPDGRRFFIQDMSKPVQRGDLPKLTIDGFRVLKV